MDFLKKKIMGVQQEDDLSKPCHCPKHTSEVVRFFCEDHKTLLCSVCVSLGHQSSSCKVTYIPEMAKDFIDGKEYREILKTMESISEQFCNLQERTYRLIAKSNRTLADALDDIKIFRGEMNKRLDELEEKVAHKTKGFHEENSKISKQVESTCNDITTSLRKSCQSIKQLNTTKQANKLFVKIKHAERMIKDYEKSLLELSDFDVKGYIFTPNETLSEVLASERFLGTLVQKALHEESKAKVSHIVERELSYKEDICVKTSKDITMCWITGITLLTFNILVITDHNNKAVKMVDTSSQSVSDQLLLDGHPLIITSITNTELAVTIATSDIIQFIAVSSSKLKKQHSLRMGEICHGISSYQGKLVVSFGNPAKVQVFHMDCTPMKTIQVDFSFPMYITAIRNSIYVSDRDRQTVTRIDWRGNVLGSYSDIDQPQGISLSDDGTVFVCDYLENAIEEISEDFSTGKVVLKALKGPQAVCWCGEKSELYYSSNTCTEKYNNFLHIYKCS